MQRLHKKLLNYFYDFIWFCGLIKVEPLQTLFKNKNNYAKTYCAPIVIYTIATSAPKINQTEQTPQNRIEENHNGKFPLWNHKFIIQGWLNPQLTYTLLLVYSSNTPQAIYYIRFVKEKTSLFNTGSLNLPMLL